MPRLFTAIEIPPDIGFGLSLLKGGLPGARWIPPENYHLTLRFIGDVDRATAAAAADILDDIVRPGFTLTLAGLGAFGTRNPRAIVALTEPEPALTELQAAQERALQRIGLPPERRKFTPHVTLARLGHGKPRPVADYLALRGGYRSRPFQVDRFVLFSARDGTGGGPYIVEHDYPLETAETTMEIPW